jgi:hypothetical protein
MCGSMVNLEMVAKVAERVTGRNFVVERITKEELKRREEVDRELESLD